MIKKLVGLVFMALVFAMVLPSTRQMLQEDVFKPIGDGVKGSLVPRRLNAMADQLEFRLNRSEGFPPNWEGWLRRDFTGSPQDPWGNVYYLEARRGDFMVGSAAGDGEVGTDDDITITRALPRGG